MKQFNVRFMVQLALLLAVTVLLAITPLGYITIGIVEITLIHIPVLIGAVVLGPLAGLVLGVAFGVTSVVTATVRPTLTGFMFSPFITGGNFGSLVIAMVPRILMGVLAAWVFRALCRIRVKAPVSGGVAAACGTLCNTVLVLGGMCIFFGRQTAELFGVAGSALFLGVLAASALNGVIELLLAVIICSALAGPLVTHADRH